MEYPHHQIDLTVGLGYIIDRAEVTAESIAEVIFQQLSSNLSVSNTFFCSSGQSYN